MRVIRFFRDIAPGDGSGGGPSLADLLNPDYVPPVTEGLEPDGITLKTGYIRNGITSAVGKDPDYKEPNPGQNPPKAPAPQKPTPAGTEEGTNADGTLKDGYIREDGTDKIIKDPNYVDPNATPGLNTDGTLQEGYIKDEQGNVIEDPNYDPGEGDETGQKFIEAVEAITGINYKVEYPEGTLPTSPEGIALREKTIREASMLAFENDLEQRDPRGYAYFLHRAAGGKDDEFFGDQKGFQLPDTATMNASADVQASVYKQELLVKGLDASTAQILVDAAVKDNSLLTKAANAHALLDKAQKDQLDNLKKRQDAADKAFNDNLTSVTNSIMDGIKNEMGFIVPEAKQPEFRKFVISSLRYDDAEGKFYTTQAIEPQNLKNILESMFFQYSKGDLSSLVLKKAKTQAAQTLRLKLPGNGPRPGSGGSSGNSNRDNLPLSSIL